jgi:hypothetical protein
MRMGHFNFWLTACTNTVSLAYTTLLDKEIVHWVGIIMVEYGPHQYA